jgi:serine/threonine protein kinase
MTWEAYQNVGPFDAEGRDLWACLVSLFNIVTGFPVYRIPTDEDILFVYNIMAQALSTNPDNLDATVVLQAHPRLHQMRNILGVLSPQLRELFQNALHFDPAQRWMIDDVIACAWLRGPPYPP